MSYRGSLLDDLKNICNGINQVVLDYALVKR